MTETTEWKPNQILMDREPEYVKRLSAQVASKPTITDYQRYFRVEPKVAETISDLNRDYLCSVMRSEGGEFENSLFDAALKLAADQGRLGYRVQNAEVVRKERKEDAPSTVGITWEIILFFEDKTSFLIRRAVCAGFNRLSVCSGRVKNYFESGVWISLEDDRGGMQCEILGESGIDYGFPFYPPFTNVWKHTGCPNVPDGTGEVS